MGKLRELRDKLKRVSEAEVEDELLKIIKEHSDTLIDFNTDQLLQGVDANGDPLEPYRSASYAEFKLTLNPRGVVDLKLTGDFHESFIVNNQFPIRVGATDPKTEELRAKYGDDIFGLSKSSLKELSQNYLKEDIQRYFRDLLRVR